MSNITTMPGTTLDVITGLYVKDVPSQDHWIVTDNDGVAYAIFTSEIEAKKWLLKSPIQGLFIVEF